MGYSSDLTDDQWTRVFPFIPAPKFGGRPRTTDERQIVNAILYIVTAGCKWRLLPTNFPPWQTVYSYYAAWCKKGIWQKLHYALYESVRREAGRNPQPSVVVIDSQSVKTGKVAPIESRGYDGGKNVKGRKRHLVTDTLGLLVDLAVTPANEHDTVGGAKALDKFAKRQKSKTVELAYADKGYRGEKFANWVKAKLGAIVTIGENLAQKVKQFIPAKKRWVVERSFAWLGDYWRLSVDRERLLLHSMSMIRIAFIRVMLRQLHPPPDIPGEW
jgi:transposase